MRAAAMNWPEEIRDEVAKNWHEWLIALAGSACVLFRKKVGEFFGWLWRKINASAIAIIKLTETMEKVDATLVAVKTAVENQGKNLEAYEQQVSMSIAMANVLLGYHTTAMWICDADGKCVFANSALCELFGLEEAEMLGTGWTRAIDADDMMNVQTVWDTFREHPERQYKSRYRIVKHGSRTTVDASGSVIKTISGRVAGFIGKVEVLPPYRATPLDGICETR